MNTRKKYKKKYSLSSKNKLWTQLKVGSKVAIFWDDDKCYYPCTVEGRHHHDEEANGASSSFSRFFVRYDDGESEWTDMAQEKLRWLDDDDDNEEDDEDNTDNEAGTTTIGKRTTKKRNHCSIDDDDESHDNDDDNDEEQE